MKLVVLVAGFTIGCVSTPSQANKSQSYNYKKSPTHKVEKKKYHRSKKRQNHSLSKKQPRVAPVPKDRLPADMKNLLNQGYVLSNVVGTVDQANCDWKNCKVKMKAVTVDSTRKGQLEKNSLKDLSFEVKNAPLHASKEFFPPGKFPAPGRTEMATGKSLSIIPKNIKKGKIKDEVKLVFINVLYHAAKGVYFSPVSKVVMIKNSSDQIVTDSRNNLTVMAKDW